jgi:hypothetical protein
VAAALPSEKSLGPDRLTGLFVKTCWPIIHFEFYRLFHEFWEGSAEYK